MTYALRNDELADRLGISEPEASRIRRGKRLPSTPTILALAKAYDLSAMELLEAHGKGAEAFARYLNKRLPLKRMKAEVDK